MKKESIENIIQEIARLHGMTESEIRAEMEEAIMQGYINRDKNELWENMFGKDGIPSVEEFIVAVLMESRNRN